VRLRGEAQQAGEAGQLVLLTGRPALSLLVGGEEDEPIGRADDQGERGGSRLRPRLRPLAEGRQQEREEGKHGQGSCPEAERADAA
jgi:hypothetical protein